MRQWWRGPEPRSSSWLWLGIGFACIVTAVFWFTRYVMIGQAFEWQYAWRLAALAAGVSLAAHLAGWFGLRLLWLSGIVGTLIGAALMIVYSGDLTGWEDLISFLTFLMVTIGGFVLGIVLEVIRWIVRRKRA